MMHNRSHQTPELLDADSPFESVAYDKDGAMISLAQLSELKYGPNGEHYRHVDLDQIGDVEVSTVWVGFNLRLDDGPPLIFETAAFTPHRTEVFGRYATEDDAHRGHKHAVQIVLDEMGDWGCDER